MAGPVLELRGISKSFGAIRALTVDLDPTKVKGGDLTGQHFRRERERLLSVVKSAAADPQCPPTLANDSGGGFQLIWHLKPPVPAEGKIVLEGVPQPDRCIAGHGREASDMKKEATLIEYGENV